MNDAQFLDPVDLRIVHDGGVIVFQVLRSFTFFHHEREVTVPHGFQSTGAHKPFKSPCDFGGCIRAGILHDYMRRSSEFEPGDADRWFCDALRHCGVRDDVIRQTFTTLTATRYLRGEHND